MNTLLKKFAGHIGRSHTDSVERSNPSDFSDLLHMKERFAGDDGMVADISAVSALISAWRSLPDGERNGNEHSIIIRCIWSQQKNPIMKGSAYLQMLSMHCKRVMRNSLSTPLNQCVFL